MLFFIYLFRDWLDGEPGLLWNGHESGQDRHFHLHLLGRVVQWVVDTGDEDVQIYGFVLENA